jgi:hypothetical protein
LDIKPFTAFIVDRVRWSLEHHDLTFPEPEGRYNFDRGVVVFWAHDGNRRVRCGISREALEDHFGGDNRDLVEVFQEHRKEIEERVRHKYLAGDSERDGSVLIRTSEL